MSAVVITRLQTQMQELVERVAALELLMATVTQRATAVGPRGPPGRRGPPGICTCQSPSGNKESSIGDNDDKS